MSSDFYGSEGASGGCATGQRAGAPGSSHSTSRREAEKLLAKRQAELSVGSLTAPDTKRVTFTDMAQLIRDDYPVRDRRSLDRLELSLAHLERFFGACRALSITSDRVTAYGA